MMATTPSDGYFEAVWPRAPKQTTQRPVAPRLQTLDGKTVAFVWDMLFKGDEIFKHLQQGLSERFVNIEFVDWEEFGSTHSKNERQTILEITKKLRAMKVDAVISGMAC